jgi:3-oxoacyl-[acyl-carrier-protein] synthase II
MVRLTHYRTAYTTTPTLLDELTFPQKVHWFEDTYSRTSTGMVYPPHKLADKVLDPELLKYLRENPSKKTAFILAAGNTHFAGINGANRQSRLTYGYRVAPLTLTQVYAGRVAQSCGATDHIVTDSTACASSLKVMMDVQTLIRMYGFTRVVVLTLEDAVSNMVLEFFGEARACLTLKEEADGKQPSAFDTTNGGFYVGQGAALAVFESTGTGVATLEAAYTASEECTNPLGQLPSGEGFVRAIDGALSLAGVSPKDIRQVKTHGTGTPTNNTAEAAALQTVLPDGFVATSYKPTIGHTMGASGLLESLLMIESLQSGIVPAIKNRTQDDKVFLSEDCKATDSRFLSLAAGMGNVYSAAVWSIQ